MKLFREELIGKTPVRRTQQVTLHSAHSPLGLFNRRLHQVLCLLISITLYHFPINGSIALRKYYKLKSNTSDANYCVGEWVVGVKYSGLTYGICYKNV